MRTSERGGGGAGDGCESVVGYHRVPSAWLIVEQMKGARVGCFGARTSSSPSLDRDCRVLVKCCRDAQPTS